MKYNSTRNTSEKISAAQAIARGLAADGGLFVPETLPHVSLADVRELCALSYRERAVRILSLFLEDFEKAELERFAESAYADNYDDAAIAPLRQVTEDTFFLELWHGPTCAFKDMALQMLPYLLTASLKKTGEEREVCILVATSGDTGKAALEGFKDVPGTRIFIFYPQDGVSEIQKLQMITQEGGNVGVCAVVGNFDDAQTGVKEIFSDAAMAETLSKRGFFLSSANSINWGRLLPQIVYYFSAYCDAVNSGRIALGDELIYCVPTGNFGNILAGWYAKQMGLPAGRFVCASNENNVLTDFIRTGVYDKNRPFHTTISPSMDILVSSNLERLLFALSGEEAVRTYMDLLKQTGRYAVSEEIRAAVQKDFSAGYCDDAATKNAIREVFERCSYLMDTHTAVAYRVLADYRAESGDTRPAVVVSTASPYKFASDVLTALGETAAGDVFAALSAKSGTEIPGPLSGLEKRPVRFTQSVDKLAMPDAVLSFLM